MSINQLVDEISPEAYEGLRRAVETGKWQNGSRLSQEQLENSLQLLIAYDARHRIASERVGYVEPKTGAACDSTTDSVQILTVNNR